MKIAIAIDAWKLPIFEQHLQKAGFEFKNVGNLTKDSLLLTVETDKAQALGQVVVAANKEAARTAPTPTNGES